MDNVKIRTVRYKTAYVSRGETYLLMLRRSEYTGDWRAYRWDGSRSVFCCPSFGTERRTARAAARAAVAHFGL